MSRKRGANRYSKRVRAVEPMQSVPQAIHGTELFNGNVLEPWPIVIIVTLVGLGLLALLIWGVFDLFSLHIPENLAEKSIFVTEIQEDNHSAILLAEDRTTYRLPIPVQSLDVHEQETLTVRYEVDVSAKELTVWFLADESGSILATPEQVYAAIWNKSLHIILVTLAIILAYWSFSIGGYYIVSNADRYPRLARLFIRKDFLLIRDASDDEVCE